MDNTVMRKLCVLCAVTLSVSVWARFDVTPRQLWRRASQRRCYIGPVVRTPRGPHRCCSLHPAYYTSNAVAAVSGAIGRRARMVCARWAVRMHRLPPCRRNRRTRVRWRRRRNGAIAATALCNPYRMFRGSRRSEWAYTRQTRDDFDPDFKISRWVHQEHFLNDLDAECKHHYPSDASRCFELVPTRVSTDGVLPTGDIEDERNGNGGYSGYRVCINANRGRLATIDNAELMHYLHNVHKRFVTGHPKSEHDVKYACAAVDAYPRNWEKGSTVRDQWITKYSSNPKHAHDFDGELHLSPKVWADGEPNNDPGGEPAGCACLDYTTGKLNDVRCHDWQYVLCEYTRSMPELCVPLGDDLARCFKIKPYSIRQYWKYWRSGDANEYHSRQCHERTPGRLANIDSAAAKQLALDLMEAAQSDANECAMVDGVPGFYQDEMGDGPMGTVSRETGSTDRQKWRVGNNMPMSQQFWGEGQPDNQATVGQTSTQLTCACLHRDSGVISDVECIHAASNMVLCEFQTPARHLRAQNDSVPFSACGHHLISTIYQTCESMRARIYPYYCPSYENLMLHFSHSPPKPSGTQFANRCCEGSCLQLEIVYHCCEALGLYGENTEAADARALLLHTVRRHYAERRRRAAPGRHSPL